MRSISNSGNAQFSASGQSPSADSGRETALFPKPFRAKQKDIEIFNVLFAF